jgi:hypothetical protein
MYLLGKEFFKKWGGVVSAIFYVWAPYHSVDVYVRAATRCTSTLEHAPRDRCSRPRAPSRCRRR